MADEEQQECSSPARSRSGSAGQEFFDGACISPGSIDNFAGSIDDFLRDSSEADTSAAEGGTTMETAAAECGESPEKAPAAASRFTSLFSGRLAEKANSPPAEEATETAGGSEPSDQAPAAPLFGSLFSGKSKPGITGTRADKVAGAGEVSDTWSSLKKNMKASMNSKVQEALPAIREMRHKTREFHNNVKEQVTQKKQQLLHEMVDGIELGSDQRAAAKAAGSASVGVEATRWWSEACAAAHRAHDLDTDPPAPPQRAESSRPGAESGFAARGCLEVEVLSFSTTPALSRPDGGLAIRPVCQAAVGSRYTGALLPLAAYVVDGHQSFLKETDESAGDSPPRQSPSTPALGDEETNAAEPAEASEPDAAATGEASSVCRFAIDEIVGVDLRLHVFDSQSHRFSIGLEDQVFCGGTILPLSLLVRRGASRTFCMQGFRHREITDVMDVTLLPLEAVRLCRKLKLPEPLLERPTRDLGCVSLRLTLTLYEMVPAKLYMTMPFHSDAVEATSANNFGSLDDPMSVLKAVAVAAARLNGEFAAAKNLLIGTFNAMIEVPHTSALLHMLWAYAMLVAPAWKLPVIFVVVVAMVFFQISKLGRKARHDDPPRLYKDEVPESTMTMKEKGKKHLAAAIQVEINMMKFAQTLTECATILEKLRFVVMLRDPYLSMLCGGFLVAGALGATIMLAVFLLIFGSFGPPLLIWMYGCLLLLPRYGREWFEETKERILGPDKIVPTLASFWARIPDGVEAQHCELFDRYCMEAPLEQ